MKYSIQDFLSSKIALEVSEKDRPEFNRLMDEAGMEWMCGCRASEHRRFPCRADGKALRDGRGSLPVVKFSDLLPADPWAEFCAGKCWFRVRKCDWAEFAKQCAARGIKWQYGVGSVTSYKADFRPDAFLHMNDNHDKNRGIFQRPGLQESSDPILDFSDLLPAPAKAPEPPAPYDGRGKHKAGDLFEVIEPRAFNVGDIVELSLDDHSACPQFRRIADGERHYYHWHNLKPHTPTTPSPRIEIAVAGRVTTATLYEDGKAVRTGTAKCSLEDEFEFMEGAAWAFERLRNGTDARLVDEDRVAALAERVKELADKIKEAVR